MQSFQLKEADRLIASPFLPLRFPLPMKVAQLKGTFWALWALVLVGFCWCGEKSVVVVGVGKCADCAEKNVKSSDAFSGMMEPKILPEGCVMECWVLLFL